MANISSNDRIFDKDRITDRQISELIGLSKAFLMDGKIDQKESETLQTWLVANKAANENPLIVGLLERVSSFLEDGILDDEEAKELFEFLDKLVGGNIEIGELIKATNLPLTNPPPIVVFKNRNFCFTGTFFFGNRKDCEAAVIERGGNSTNLNTKTHYLVIGSYATNSWVQSSWGRKIENAIRMIEKGRPLAIISEKHWCNVMKESIS